MSTTGWRTADVRLLDPVGAEALTRAFIGRLSSVPAEDVLLGDYERGVVLVAEAEVACMVAVGESPRLVFHWPPLTIDVEAVGAEPPGA